MIRALLAAVVAVTVAVLMTLPASAHTAMLRASPDRNAVVGGSIQVIDLEFLDPITDATVMLRYNGTPLAGTTTVPDGEVITFALDQPLTQPGRYQVSYEMISLDGDFTTGGYFFTFDPAAAQPARIEAPASGGVSTNTVLAASAIGLAALVGLLVFFIRRTDVRRRHEDFEPDGYDHADERGEPDYHW
ncbi:MAG: copper resistance protein CopC [Actinomycetota bacterium]